MSSNGFRLLAAGLATVLGTPVALAHHGVAGYDMDEVLELEGVVEHWGWQNPHTSLTLRLVVSGRVETVLIEGAPPRWMSGQGWTPESLEAGENVTITYHPTRLAGQGYDGILMEVERGNGDVLKVNRPAWLGGP